MADFSFNANNEQEFWNKQAERAEAEQQKRLENRKRFGVELNDEEYATINNLIADADNQDEEAHKIGSALLYSKQLGCTIDEAYAKLDDYNEALFEKKPASYRNAFTAIGDAFIMGNNSLKIGDLGNQLREAEINGDEEKINLIMKELEAIDNDNALRQDNTPRSWITEAIKCGAQTLPFSAEAAGVGLFGNFIVPGLGTALAFGTSSSMASGQEYIDMRKEGVSPETARKVAAISGGIQGLVEVALGTTTDYLLAGAGKQLSKTAVSQIADKVTERVAKRFHYGAGKKLALKLVGEWTLDKLGEGTEEAVQEITSIIADDVARSMDGLGLSEETIAEKAQQVADAFKGGIVGAIVLGLPLDVVNTHAQIKDYKNVAAIATQIPSEEVFKNAVKDNPVFSSIKEEDRDSILHDVWNNAQAEKEASEKLRAKEISEVTTAADETENIQVDEETGEELETAPEYRDENGKLKIQNDIESQENGITKGSYRVGNPELKENNLYGFINYSVDENNKTVTIEEMKLSKVRGGLRNEFFDNFARDYAGYNIDYKTIGKDAEAIKNSLIENNPSGSKNGLNYYADLDAVSDIDTRKKIASEVRKNINLTNDEVISAVSLIESMAKGQNKSITDYVNETFSNNIFGSLEEVEQQAQLQGDTFKGKAGAMQWKKFGQQVKAVIYAGENADFSTWAHELAHVYQAQLSGDLKLQAEKAFNVENGDWNRSTYNGMSSAEAFAYGFQDWLKTGKAPNAELKNIFQKFAEFLVRCKNAIGQHIQLNKDIEDVYNQLLKGDDSVLKAAENAVLEQDAETRRQNAYKKAQAEKEAAKVTTEETNSETEITEDNNNNEVSTKNNTVSLDDTPTTVNETVENIYTPSLSEQGKKEIADILKNPETSVEEKSQTATEVTGEEYKNLDVLFQMIGERAIQELGERDNKDKIFLSYRLAMLMDQRGYSAADIKKYTLCEKDPESGLWYYEFDDSQQRSINQEIFNKISKIVDASKLNEAFKNYIPFNLGQYLSNKELFGIYSKMNLGNVTVDFINDASKYWMSHLDGNTGITINLAYTDAGSGTNGFKRQLIYQLQNIINHYDNMVISEEKDRMMNSRVAKRAYMSEQERRNSLFFEQQQNKINFQIIGEFGAKELDRQEEVSTRIDNLNIAREMEKAGRDAKTIRLATGWEKGADGKWKYEIDDNNFKYDFLYGELDFKKKFPRYEELTNKFMKFAEGIGEYPTEEEVKELDLLSDEANKFYYKKYGKVKDILDAPELFKAYPFLKDIKVTFKNDPQNTTLASIIKDMFDVGFTIQFNKFPNEDNQNSFKNDLLHELQHAIQEEEGFGKGGNPDTVNNEVEILRYNFDLVHYYDEIIKKYETNPEYYSYNQTAIINDINKEYIDSGFEELIPSEDIQTKAFNRWVTGKNVSEEEQYLKLNGLDLRTPNSKISNNKYINYKKLAGEVESRNIEKRMNMTPEERLNTLLAETEDVARDQQIILFQAATMQNDNTILYQTEEEQEVRKQYENTDKWLKAPNGENTNLSEKQWVQVRTPSFKKWFGDWENDPINASKIIDENGEPLVVYHGTTEDFDVFDKTKGRSSADIQGMFFSPWEIDAGGYGQNLRAFYLNIKNPATFKDGYKALQLFYKENERGIKAREYLVQQGFDGVNNDNEEYIAFEPNQIKSATDNSGAFNSENPSILFQKQATDEEYENAVNSGNIEKATEMLLKKATENGYVKQSYFGEGSWAAPTAGVEKEQFTDLEALQQYVDDYGDEVNIYGIINGIQAHQEDYYFNPDRAGFHGQDASETAQVLRKLRYDKARPETKVTVYRAVPNDVKGEKLLAGDWIALSKTYCEEHGKNRYGIDNYHIIEEEVPISNIWQSSEDMREFGFDDGNKDVENNVPNNRKLLEITYDENGKLIPLSERFNKNNPSILFQTAYHGSAANFDNFNTEQYGLTGEGSMSFGYGTYVTGSEEIARDYAERQFSQKFNVADKKSRLEQLKERIIDDEKKLKTLETPEAFNKERDESTENILNDIELFKAAGKSTTWLENLLKDIPEQYTEEKRIMYLKSVKASLEQDKNEIAELEKQIKEIESVKDPKRHLYTIDIPDNGFIKWDKTVPKATRTRIVNELYNTLIKGDYSGAERELRYELAPMINSPLTGQELYQDIWTYLGSDKDASQFLNKLGYVGIDYPAGTNFGTDIPDARNYVIFNDSDAQIIGHLQYQTQEELYKDAMSFDTWQDFMDFYETMGKPEVTPIPYDADAQYYQTTWELAHNMLSEQQQNEETISNKKKDDGTVPTALDAMFTSQIVNDDEKLMDFLHVASYYSNIDLNSDEYQHPETEEDAKELQRIAELQDFIDITFADRNFGTALSAIKGGNEVPPSTLKKIRTEMRDGIKVRDFRALYSELMNDEELKVDVKDTVTSKLKERLAKYEKRYYDILKPGEDISKSSPERRKQISNEMDNRDIAAKLKNGTLKMDDEVYSYVKSLDKQIKELEKQYNELQKETQNDYSRIASAEKRELLRLNEKLLLAKGKLDSNNNEIARKIQKGIKITSKYEKNSQNLKANYDEIFRKFMDLKNSIEINKEVEEALKRQEQVNTVRQELNGKQKEKSLANDVKKMRIQLVKRTMRRVPFDRIDYDNARTLIAIQRMFEPNLMGGINRWIGIDTPYVRGVISNIVTDEEYKKDLIEYLKKYGKESQQFADFLKLVEDTNKPEDFANWTMKDYDAAKRYFPKENWIKELNLKELAKEREESIDLPIEMIAVKKPSYDEKGNVKKYKDENGEEKEATVTAWRLQAAPEIEQLVKDAVGADMYNNLINVPFAEWTTEQLEALAYRVNKIYTEGKELLEAKKEARKEAANNIRLQIVNSVKDTGIVINDDDTPEEKDKKYAKINSILGLNSEIKGTQAAEKSGIKARINNILHGYNDANVLRVARILDGNKEGVNVNELYRKEDECYNNKQRSINERAKNIVKVMKDNNITFEDLAQTVNVNGRNYTIDELLYFAAANEDYQEDEKLLAKGKTGLDANDDYAATSRNAVMFGNMFSDTESAELKESFKNEDEDIKKRLESGDLTQAEKETIAAGFSILGAGTKKYIAACHDRYAAVLSAVEKLDDKYKPLLKAIADDYATQYERMNEISIKELNQPVNRVKCYVPLVRLESNGDTNVNKVKEDLLALMGQGSAKEWVNKGMTKRRTQISPLNQKPVQTGLYKTWADSVERTEHFIAYTGYVNELNRVYKSRDAQFARNYIENRYGKGMIRYIDDYINEVANPNANKTREAGSNLLHALRGRTAPAYLAWKASAIVKQGLTSPWPYMQYVNPLEYMAASIKAITSKGKIYDAIREKSVYMNNRVMDPMNDLIDELAESGKTKFDRAIGKQSQIGMKGLEFIDWVCVAPGWYACYEKEYARFNGKNQQVYEETKARLTEENAYVEYGTSEWKSAEQIEKLAQQAMVDDVEKRAVQYADDCTRACQPSNRAADIAPLFKNSSEAMKAYLQFQTSLNVIWQNLRYDIPYNLRTKQFSQIAGCVIGYVLAGIFMNSVMEGYDKDDDDETLALKQAVYYATTQFTDSVPMVGSEITNTMDKIITGKGSYQTSGTDMTPTLTKLLAILTNAKKGNWEKAAQMTAEGIGMYLGLPVSGAKEIEKLVGIGDNDGELNVNLGNVYGILDNGENK